MVNRCRGLAVGFLFAFGIGVVHAHGGGLDGRGCHVSSEVGNYHCHQGKLAGETFDSEAEARQALGNQGRDGGTGGRSTAPTGGAYDRDAYGDWRDRDGDCQSTRDEVLIEYARSYKLGPRGCDVVAGVWRGPYTGERLTDPANIHIDHIVPLKEGHISGAANWPRRRKQRFANDPANLWPVHGPTNMSKGAADPAEWLPERNRCEYIERWVGVKRKYDLSMDAAERQAISRVRDSC